MSRKCRKGQSILEYTLLLAALIGVLITVLTVFKPKVQETYNATGDALTKTTNSLSFGVFK